MHSALFDGLLNQIRGASFKEISAVIKVDKALGISAKCRDMMDKVHLVQQQNNGGVVVATGTPITDSITGAYIKIAEEGYTMLRVSHEMNFVRHVINRAIFLDGGHIVEDGFPSEVFSNPKN